jgi:hypothetical protein
MKSAKARQEALICDAIRQARSDMSEPTDAEIINRATRKLGIDRRDVAKVYGARFEPKDAV